MFIFVGLGNPGDKYKNNRHNIGFKIMDSLSDNYEADFNSQKSFNCDLSSTNIAAQKIKLCKPKTFMNLSGDSLLALCTYYKLSSSDFIVFHDDIDLEIGQIKYKQNGSNGGHNGLRSIDSKIGKNYHRIRIGVGRPDDARMDVSDYVLGNFTNEEEEEINLSLKVMLENVDLLATQEFELFKQKISRIN